MVTLFGLYSFFKKLKYPGLKFLSLPIFRPKSFLGTGQNLPNNLAGFWGEKSVGHEKLPKDAKRGLFAEKFLQYDKIHKD